MKFVDALKEGKTEFGMPETVITTLVSDIALCNDRVVKVYKHEKYFFADLLTSESRKAFYEEDFFWNNTAAPEIYLHLSGVRETGDKFELVPPSQGDDFIIQMSKIDDSKTLTKLLIRKELTEQHIRGFVDALVDTLKTLTRERQNQLAPLFERGLLPIMRDNTRSLYDWMLTQEAHVPREHTEDVYKTLSEILEVEPYFKNITSKELTAAIDNNSDNLILRDGKPSFIDIMPPMTVWRVVDEYATLSRFIVDVEALGGETLGKTARDAYAKYNREIPKRAQLMHELRASCIQWPYRYMLGQHDLAKIYGGYALDVLRKLKGSS